MKNTKTSRKYQDNPEWEKSLQIILLIRDFSRTYKELLQLNNKRTNTQFKHRSRIYRDEGLPGGTVVKKPPAVQEMGVRPLGGEDPLEKEMATHSSILAWRFLWTEEPGELQSMWLQRVGHD